MKNEIVDCIGLINSGGFKYLAKCRLFLTRKEFEYYYLTKKGKVYLGYPVDLYTGKKKLHSEVGRWHIERQAFETVNDKGQTDFWYDNDFDMIKKISKYGKLQIGKLKKQVLAEVL